MTFLKLVTLLGLTVSLAACANQDVTTRSVDFESTQAAASDSDPLSFADVDAPVAGFPAVSVKQISVVVPRALEVSEANRYLPAGDIVWREDPVGDRHAQVQKIFEAGLGKGTQNLKGGTPVSLYVQVMRFHALTEKARYSTGGVHSIKFGLAVRDLNTGRILGQPRVIEADLNALGGRIALAAEAKGQTQKVRITDHLAEVIRQELTQTDGHKNAKLGLIQQLNKF